MTEERLILRTGDAGPPGAPIETVAYPELVIDAPSRRGAQASWVYVRGDLPDCQGCQGIQPRYSVVRRYRPRLVGDQEGS